MDLLRRKLLAAIALCAAGCIAPDTLTTRLLADAAVGDARDAADVVDAPCPLRQVRCGGVCVGVDSDAMNCGACGVRCERPHANTLCAAGTCRTTTCETGYGDCNGVASDGCEVFVAGADVTNCGRCSSVCTAAPTGASPVCRAGVCGISAVVCPAGVGNCDGADANGCETDVTTSVTHCGACGRPCSLAHATARCVGGACAVGACEFGFLDCDGVAANGCEVSATTDTSNCGVCGRVCPTPAGTTATCASGVCTTRIGACPAGTADCNGSAADGCEATDVNTNASRCGPTCAVCNGTHGTATCTAGVCGVRCGTGFANCDGLASNGCETPTTTVSNCGTCGNACSLFASTEACTSMSCTIASCNSGFLNCDGTAANGCEVDSRTNNAHCGMCGRACTVSGQSCSGGACQCPAGQIVCVGACRDLQTDRAYCGSCGLACTAGLVCVSGLCRASCPSGQTECSGACRDLTGDRNHCGACGNVCPASQICAGSACVTSCAAGLTACGASCRDLTSDASNCGACGAACPSGQSCVRRVCTQECPAGQANCSGTCRDLRSDVANCGACGAACPSGQVCSSGACATTCAAGLSNCAGSCTNTSTDPRHCSACGAACATRANAAATCSGGACGFACSTGFADCDATAANGCEVNTQSDLANCGICRGACSLSNAVPACVSGACAVASCNTGFANCNSMAGDGCEVDTRTSNAHCGMCGRACEAGTTCAASACVACGAMGQPACDGTRCTGLSVCGGRCTSIQSDSLNCGACGSTCSTTQTCVTGLCVMCGGDGQRACDRGAECSGGLVNCSGICRAVC